VLLARDLRSAAQTARQASERGQIDAGIGGRQRLEAIQVDGGLGIEVLAQRGHG
jgi:hypothetical protein